MEPSSMFGILSSLLVLGIGFILLFILLSLVIGAISLYLSGKIVKSINDEFLSAIKAIAYGFLLGIGITIVMWLFAFLGTKIASLQSVFEILNSLMIILYIVVFFIIVKKIYDLNIIKTFLMLVVAFVINGVIGAIIAIIFGGFFFGTIAEKIASQVATEPVAVVEEEKIEDEAITEEEIAEEEAEPGKRPGIPKKEPEEVVEEEDIELAAKTCTFSYECNQTDEFCLEGVCKSKDQLTAKFGLSLCDQPCENCVSGKIEKTFINYDPDEWGGSMRIRPKTQMIEGFTDDDEYEAEICTECIDDFSCKEGYGCKNFKCVEGYLSEGSKKNANIIGPSHKLG